jgi:diaminopimelate epimerase
VPFFKAHGLGNDFLFVEEREIPEAKRDEFARNICDRHTGVGADGLVLLGPSEAADSVFRIYNSDGSEAPLSGNALRCAAALLLARRGGEPAPGQTIRIETRVGIRALHYLERRGIAWLFRAEMGAPRFAAADVPFRPPLAVREPIVGYPLPVGDVTIPATILHMGNPQCIVIQQAENPLDWLSVGPDLERHPFFPDRANVGFVRVLGPDRIQARFWERGAGHTLASGTGSCACAVAAHLNGQVGREVRVEVERGEMDVRWRNDGVVELTGPAEIMAEGVFHWPVPAGHPIAEVRR